MTRLTNPYWNPILETLPREKLLALELKNFRRHIRYAKDHTPLFHHKLAGIEPEDIRTIDDVKRIPLTDKEDLRLSQAGEKPSIFGDLLGVDPGEVSLFRQTSGTTGKPVYVPESYESWQWRTEVWCHILWMAGFRDTHRVLVPFGYNVYVAFWEGHYAAEKLGCLVVPGGSLDSAGRINKIQEVGANALMNTPTYGLHLAETAQSMGLDARKLGIERMICAGEPMTPAARRQLEDAWDAEVYDHIGGTEPCAWGAMCSERNGLHTLEPHFLVEILDMETMTREVDAGELGVAVVTPLGRRSFPLVRFNTQDVVRKGRTDCPCGRTSRMISGIAGRADHLTKVRGVLFNPLTVDEVLRDEFPEIYEYEIIVERAGSMDELTLKIEPLRGVEVGTIADLKPRLAERLKMKTNLRFHLQTLEPGELPRYTLKAKRFKDLRRSRDHG